MVMLSQAKPNALCLFSGNCEEKSKMYVAMQMISFTCEVSGINYVNFRSFKT